MKKTQSIWLIKERYIKNPMKRLSKWGIIQNKLSSVWVKLRYVMISFDSIYLFDFGLSKVQGLDEQQQQSILH